ncbi:uncharacterized protein LOC110442612 [Mizuhopecten yessoensis]|uniref:Ankyrin repeat domain-containing protein 35 n=1 Tax=Mizuhopecten yessoensis TaxID=6573 RepID=A0A210PGS5_MIZYE|nr:uncharacterized protein LOC110442612 [Mizuhopecten yessoensis]XP_021341972.1 uncharacterized protein LOC110442612 [Mizuhopecten yessoensis]XP_021341973.1 uncharacterized protein LOC110442612 [Mizuhopecten yessoensis]XP_021341974.1 uncharacterized protein LOC110442612 [Mizuhopecten yessoensis]XP_021341975.1 uncharacterized protein LOC110442612 [Mizuhopecten yessoensis]OWF35671.1 Ankyrin repeat domain-containing protein 35 [Mizuhopecten yessoensis]
MENINILKAKSHRILDETYREKMGEYIESLKIYEEEKKYVKPPSIGLLIYASEHNKLEDLECLCLQNKLQGNLETLLKHAVMHDREDMGVWFLQKGAQFKNLFRRSLQYVAVLKGYTRILDEILKQRSVDINDTDANGETVLHLALTKDIDNPTTCRILLEHGARTDVPDRYGILPLHRVTSTSINSKMIDLLLDFNADIEALDNHGKRPLEYAFDRKFNKQTVVCHLIRRGAKIGKKFESNGTFQCEFTVPVEHLLTMIKPILREIRNRSPKANVNDMSVLDCVDLTGDVGALVDLLKENGDISSLCKSNKDATVKRLLRYVELTGSHRLRQCMQERSLSIQDKSPSDVYRPCNSGKRTIAKSLSDSSLLKTKCEDQPILICEEGEAKQHMAILHFEALDGYGFVLARRDTKWLEKVCVDPDAIDVVVIVSPSQDEESIQEVFTLAAQHLINAAHGIPREDPFKLIHIPTSNFLADPSLPNRIRSDQQFLKLSRKKHPYDFLPLHHVVLHESSTVLQKTLINSEPEDVNAEDEVGWTALHLAILLGETEMVKMLLDHEADAASRPAHCLPAFVCTEWKGNSLMHLSPLSLSVCLNMKTVVQLLTEKTPGNPYLDICIQMSYGMKTESTLLESVCREAESRYQDIGARFKPTYTVHKNQPIERVCLGFSEYVDDIEKKKDIHGVSVVIINTDISPESNWIEKTEITENEEVICKSVIDLWADYLWDQHPNLNAITAGSIASVKCPEAKSTGHIILHCSHKGYVPHESNCFPTELKCGKGTIPVAVLEGEFNSGALGGSNSDNQGERESTTCVCAASANNPTNRYPMETEEHLPLKIGMQLCKSYSAAITAHEGTLGAFVELGNGKTGFITCAHLFYKQAISEGTQPIHFSCSQQGCGADVIAPFDHFVENGLRGVRDMEIDDDRVGDPVGEVDGNVENGRNVYWECGKVVRAIFDPTLETGIDAAIVEIDQYRAPRDGSFDDIKHLHLRRAKMDLTHPPTYASGKKADKPYFDSISKDRPIRCMKLGASSGLSVGILTWKDGQIRITDSPPLGIEKDSIHKYIMKGQLVISEYNSKQFFECGDSGSAVFVMKRDGQYYYPDACLGIAIGFLDKKTFVTPIGNILDELKTANTPELDLKKFE